MHLANEVWWSFDCSWSGLLTVHLFPSKSRSRLGTCHYFLLQNRCVYIGRGISIALCLCRGFTASCDSCVCVPVNCPVLCSPTMRLSSQSEDEICSPTCSPFFAIDTDSSKRWFSFLRRPTHPCHSGTWNLYSILLSRGLLSVQVLCFPVGQCYCLASPSALDC